MAQGTPRGASTSPGNGSSGVEAQESIKKPRYDKARAAARLLIKDLKIEKAPVDVLDIARKCGLEYEEPGTFPDEVSGLIITYPDCTVVFVNKNHPQKRRRFTLAHEIYHYHVLGEKLVLEDTSMIGRLGANGITIAGRDPIEVEADAFAADILIPQTLMYNYIRWNDSAAHVAEVFDVSEQAAEISLQHYPHHRIRRQ
jgi:Zn-dependent peptidase ImmA (M78 family)